MNLIEVELSQLQVSPDANVRRAGAKDGLAELVASIKSVGLLQPLTVRRAGEKFEVVAGQRRYLALCKIHGKKRAAVPVVVIEQDTREASLAENIVRVNLHPVDEFRAYKAMVDAGATPTDIARKFGVKEKWVLQRLQLVDLAPDLHDVWLKGKLTIEQAEALTSVPDHARQIEVWKAAQRSEWDQKPDSLRRAMRREAIEQDDGRVKFVGLDAYKAAGGRMSTDLFTDQQTLLDPDILGRLVAAKMGEEIERIKAEGWAWVAEENQLPVQRWRVRELDLTPYMTPEDAKQYAKQKYGKRAQEIEEAARLVAEKDREVRARTGVIIGIDGNGDVVAETLMVMQVDDQKAEGDIKGDEAEDADGDEPAGSDEAPARAAADPEDRINFARRLWLSQQRSLALSRAMAKDPIVALRALYASMGSTIALGGHDRPLDVRATNWRGGEGNEAPTWEKLFRETEKDSIPVLAKRLTEIVARTVDLRVDKFNGSRSTAWPESSDRLWGELAKSLRAEDMGRALVDFDFATYFSKLNSEEISFAIADMGVAAKLPAKKGDRVALAVREARARGWLPVELRSAHYKGPGATNDDAAAEGETA